MAVNLPILVCDDDPGIRAALRLFFRSEGWQCEVCNSPEDALAALGSRDFALLIADLNYARDTTSGHEGTDLIRDVRTRFPELPVVAITAWGTVSIAVEAMQMGASDFIEKPWDNARLGNIVRNLLRLSEASTKNKRLNAENALLKGDSQTESWVSDSPVMQRVMNQARAIASTDVNILITGENGTGKTQLAHWIHQHSHRAARSLIQVNMGAIPGTLFESEMFGHQRGAFTDARETRVGRFELADQGTLFLDEVGNIPLGQQAKLLQVLESGRFERLGSSQSLHADVRVISATNADLAEMIQQGEFRRDLLYRLNSVEIRLPPLRDRGEDILTLARHELGQLGRKYRRGARSFSPEAQRDLMRYDWPGNVRELTHCIERAVLLAAGTEIQVDDLGIGHHKTKDSGQGATQALEALSLEDAEKWLISTALKRHRGNVMDAAEALGLSRSAFYRRLQKFGL